MPADDSLSQEPSAAHGNGDAPYWCSKVEKLPAPGAYIEHGYCRTSLDYWPDEHKQGSSDRRCPATCRHKAPIPVALAFAKVYATHGAKAAASMSKAHKENRE